MRTVHVPTAVRLPECWEPGAWLDELSTVCPCALETWHAAREEYRRVRATAGWNHKKLHAAWQAVADAYTSLRAEFRAYQWHQSYAEVA